MSGPSLRSVPGHSRPNLTPRGRQILFGAGLAFIALMIGVLLVAVLQLNSANTRRDQAIEQLSKAAQANKNAVDEANKRLRAAGEPTVATHSVPSGAAQGPAGLNGSQGAEGPQGPAGAPGQPGAPGPKGAPGPSGPKGDQGNTGGSGANGQNGPQGNPGNPGGPGAPGSNGQNGADGQQGAAGANGEPGAQGSAGPAGPQGVQGPTGPQGAPGKDGRDGQNGRGVESISCEGGQLVVHYTDGTTQQVDGASCAQPSPSASSSNGGVTKTLQGTN